MTSTTSFVDRDYLGMAAELLSGPKQQGLRLSADLGGRVLDVGCGDGADALTLASLVGPLGVVEGVDTDPAMVTAARARAEAASLDHRVRFQVASGTNLPFDDGTFDVVHAERVLQHCADPVAVVGEMTRVVRPGGKVVLIDTDWASISLASPSGDAERRVARLLLDAVPNPAAGRLLPHYLDRCGCTVDEVAPHVMAFRDLELTLLMTRLPQLMAGAVSKGALHADEQDEWLAGAQQLAASGSFFGYAVMTVAAGTVRS